MLTNAAAPTILAHAPLSAMLTNAAAPAILAHAPPSAMLTNIAAPAILALAPDQSVKVLHIFYVGAQQQAAVWYLGLP